MIQQIGESSFKPQANPLSNPKPLSQPCGDGGGAWSFQNTDAAIPNWARRNRIECIDVERAARHRICTVTVADAIRALEGATIGNVQVPWIKARTCRGGQIRTSFPQTD